MTDSCSGMFAIMALAAAAVFVVGAGVSEEGAA